MATTTSTIRTPSSTHRLARSRTQTISTPNLATSYSRPRLPTPSNINRADEPPLPSPLTHKPSYQQLAPPSLPTSHLARAPIQYSDDEGGSSPFVMAPSTPAAGAARRMVSMGNGANNTGGDIEVGDTVDVPGNMYGTVKFVGRIDGKGAAIFAGVELAREFAGKGKNNGNVDGTQLFTTVISGSGIFLPLNRALKRNSPTISTGGSFPPTPTTPSLSSFNIGGRGNVGANGYTPPTPSMPKFSQSVGPGRAASPALRPKSRPSLPRPESPLRKAQNSGTTPAGRPSLVAPGLSKNGLGGSRYGASPTPGKFGTSVRGSRDTDPGKKLAFAPKTPSLARPASRNQSNLGPEPLFDEDADSTPVGIARSSGNSVLQRIPDEGAQEATIQVLTGKLEERDRQLRDQAASLSEMEKSLTELQSLLPSDGGGKRRSKDREIEDADTSQLRALLREKNEKISMLTAEFDAHRADFRSTIDTLEMASTETERVYEKRVDDLLQEVRELQDRGEDVESVARQLKQLEELVQELEEGLEDARRGEAEARGEVEFLRGEVERGRSELKREKEKAAEALKSVGAIETQGLRVSRDLEQRDDEIRGLKAIIHSLSRDSMISDMGSPANNSRRASKQPQGDDSQANGSNPEELNAERSAREKLERQVKELEEMVERKAYHEDELERELERLKTSQALEKHRSMNSVGSHRLSDRTILQGDWRDPGQDNIPPVPQLETMHESDTHSSVTDGSTLWCEICETSGHDILTCTNMFGTAQNTQPNRNINGQGSPHSQRSQRTGREAVIEGLKGITPRTSVEQVRPMPLSPKKSHSPAPMETPKVSQNMFPNPNETGMVPGKASGVIDETKWCALCERDGHESVDCPYEDAF